MKLVQLAALFVFSMGITIVALYDTNMSRNLRGMETPWDRLVLFKDSTTTEQLTEAVEELLNLHAEIVGYSNACTALYQKIRPGWALNLEPIPEETLELWAPVFEKEGVTMASLELQYIQRKTLASVADSPLENKAASTPLETNATETPAPAHFYCLCPKRTELCATGFCDTIITFNDTDNEFNLPGSSWTTARNEMYYLAKRRRMMAHLQGRPPESHYCFMDGDIWLKGTTKRALLDKLAKEPETSKIIAFNYRNQFRRAQYAFKMDANLNCFSQASMDDYLPYSILRDGQAWYLSQTDLIMRANLKEPFAFKIYNHVRTKNPGHNNEYPRDGYEGGLELVQRQAEEGLSPGCHPPTNNPIHTAVHECTLQGKHFFSWTFNDTHILG